MSNYEEFPEPDIVLEQSLSQRILHRFGTPLALAATALVGVGVAEIGGAEQAHADSGIIYTVEGTGDGVWSRNSPHENDTPRIDGQGAYDGDRVELECGVTDGDPVGPHNNTTWHYVKDLSRPNEPEFWLDDHWVASQNVADQLAPGESNCEDNASQSLQPAGLPGNEAVAQQTNVYNRQRAVDWALTNAKDQPPADGSCTWFVSNALWQGGLAKTSEWSSAGWLGGNLHANFQADVKGRQPLPGTLAAWNAPNLKNYLQATYPTSRLEPIDFSTANNDPKDAEIGDLVFYDWGRGEGISHVAIVTKIESNGYPDVSDWSTNDDGTLPSPVEIRGVTYSAVRHEWLQVEYPNVKAYLMHINTNQ